MGAFTGISTAPVYGAGVYFEPMPRDRDANGKEVGLGGQAWYRVKILALKSFMSKDPQKNGAFYFVAECQVLETDHPYCEPGAKRSWMVNLGQASGQSNVKGFVMGLLPGIDESEITEESMNELVDPAKQEAAGIICETRCWHVTTRSGGIFTKYTWTPDESAVANAVGPDEGDQTATA